MYINLESHACYGGNGHPLNLFTALPGCPCGKNSSDRKTLHNYS